MASKVTTLYEDSAKTNALYPRTKVSAVSDGSGNGLDALLNGKQATLISGTNIKTVNGKSVLGSGNAFVMFYPDFSTPIITYNDKTAHTYTFTQDAYVFLRFDGNQTPTLVINGRTFTNSSVEMNALANQCFVMPSGSTIQWQSSSNFIITAYPILY